MPKYKQYYNRNSELFGCAPARGTIWSRDRNLRQDRQQQRIIVNDSAVSPSALQEVCTIPGVKDDLEAGYNDSDNTTTDPSEPRETHLVGEESREFCDTNSLDSSASSVFLTEDCNEFNDTCSKEGKDESPSHETSHPDAAYDLNFSCDEGSSDSCANSSSVPKSSSCSGSDDGDGEETNESNAYPDFHQDGQGSATGFVQTQRRLNSMDVFFMVVAFIVRHCLSHAATRDLLELINRILGTDVLPRSMYFFEKSICGLVGSYTRHYFCNFCKDMIECGTNLDSEVKCKTCKRSQSTESYFLTIDVTHEIKRTLEQTEHCSLQRQSLSSSINDIQDGILYKQLYSQGFLRETDNFTYTFNTDGCPTFKSSGLSVWPIYMMLNELHPVERFKNVILSGLWVGKHDPVMHLFLGEFVHQAKKLFHEGIQWMRNGEFVTSKFAAVCCCVDSVARPLLQNMKRFNGKYGCSFCLHPGEIVGRTLKYTTQRARPTQRTDVRTLKHMEVALNTGQPHKGVKGPSPLVNVPLFRIVKGFVPDYMHCVCLGVVRQITLLWYCGPQSPHHLTPGQRKKLNSRLCNISPPNELCRFPRTLDMNKIWKAMEWKNWLLYYSVPCLKDLLPSHHIIHWSKLVSSVYILLQDSISAIELDEARKLLQEFVLGVEHLYQKEEMTFNIHLLLHLVESVENWGPLWAHSAFVFESMNHIVQKFARAPKGLAVQVAKGHLLSSSLRTMRLRGLISEAALQYGLKLTNYRNVKDSISTGLFTVLGKTLPVCDAELAPLVQYLTHHHPTLSGNSFRKVRRVIYKCLTLSSSEWVTKTCDNSKLYLSSRDYCLIEGIYVDKQSSVCILHVHLFSVKTIPHVKHLKEIVKVKGAAYVDIAAVVTKCVFIDTKSRQYIVKLSNVSEKS